MNESEGESKTAAVDWMLATLSVFGIEAVGMSLIPFGTVLANELECGIVYSRN